MSKAIKSPDRPVAVGYVRVSSKKQAADGSSLEAQREAVIREAVLSGFDLLDVFADEGISGGKDERARPGLAAALRHVEDGTAQAVIVTHSDRLARDSDLTGYVRTWVKRAGGRVVVVGESTDPMRKAVDTMIAELERIRGSQRMKLFHAQRKAKGLPAGPAPYGFETGPDGRLAPHAQEAPVVRRVVAMHGKGASLRAVASSLNADAVPTRTGAPWSGALVQKILRRAKADE